MEYLTQKVLTQLAMPLGTGCVLILVGILTSTLRHKVLGAGLSLGGVLWIWLWATPVVSDENARETLRLLADRDIDQVLLVTSAYHMRRAQATFRAAGIRVIPAATDYEVLTGGKLTLLDFLPDAKAMKKSAFTLKEYLGLWVYQWQGRAD